MFGKVRIINMTYVLQGLNFIKEGETYLITGANGFIGSAIVNALYEFNLNCAKKKPCKIILLVRNFKKAIQKYGGILYDKNIDLLIVDNKEKISISEKPALFPEISIKLIDISDISYCGSKEIAVALP